MAEIVYIPLDEMPDRLRSVFERVLRDKEIVVVDAGEEGVVTLTFGSPEGGDLRLPPGKTEEDYRAFLDSFGGWKDVDTDQLVRDIRSSRVTSS